MKLQVNESGAWRDVVSFGPTSLVNVQAFVAVLAREIAEPVRWRIVSYAARSPRSPKVECMCGGPDFTWKRR